MRRLLLALLVLIAGCENRINMPRPIGLGRGTQQCPGPNCPRPRKFDVAPKRQWSADGTDFRADEIQ